MRRFATLTLILLLGCLALTGKVAAHAVLLETAPADGAVLQQAPAVVWLRFSEPVRPIVVKIFDADGRVVTSPHDVAVRDREVRIALAASLRDGAYMVSWRVISLDAHPVGGSFLFAIGSIPTRAVRTAPDEAGRERFWSIATAVDQAVCCIALFVGAGGVLFHTLITGDIARLDRAPRRRLMVAAAIGLVTALLGIGIESGSLLNDEWWRLLDPRAWRLGAATSRGASQTIAAIGLGLIIAILRIGGGATRVLALLGAGAAIGSLAVTGHAATAEPRWLMAPLLAVHALAAAFWAGSLWPLWSLLRSEGGSATLATLRRFSRLAVGAVAILVAAGATIAFSQLGTVGALINTAYGTRLTLKLALAAVLLALAALNKTQLTPMLAAGQERARESLRASIGAEMGLAAAVLAVTASLGQSVPPRALAAIGTGSADAGYSVAAQVDRVGARVEIAPAVHGYNTMTVRLFAADGTALSPQEVTVELADPAAGIEPISRTMQAVLPGVYRFNGGELSVAGTWTVRIYALVSDFERIHFAVTILIR
jgi:copper transport protein